MKDGPDIARIASLIGDPARANMLTALMAGRALTATELAHEAGVTAQTASSHLARLVAGGLVRDRRQGRHKYVTLASDEVARVLESLMGLAAGAGHLRTRTGPRNAALRKARVCYNHLAGEMGVQLYQSLLARGFLTAGQSGLTLSRQGRDFAHGFGIAEQAMSGGKPPHCRECLDWSMRQSHLGGRAGRAFLAAIEAKGWAHRKKGSRVVAFTADGQRAFAIAFPPVPRDESLDLGRVGA